MMTSNLCVCMGSTLIHVRGEHCGKSSLHNTLSGAHSTIFSSPVPPALAVSRNSRQKLCGAGPTYYTSSASTSNFSSFTSEPSYGLGLVDGPRGEQELITTNGLRKRDIDSVGLGWEEGEEGSGLELRLGAGQVPPCRKRPDCEGKGLGSGIELVLGLRLGLGLGLGLDCADGGAGSTVASNSTNPRPPQPKMERSLRQTKAQEMTDRGKRIAALQESTIAARQAQLTSLPPTPQVFTNNCFDYFHLDPLAYQYCCLICRDAQKVCRTPLVKALSSMLNFSMPVKCRIYRNDKS